MHTWSRVSRAVKGAVKRMGRLGTVLAVAGLVLGATLAVMAAGTRAFMTGNSAFGATNAYTIVPAVGGSVAVVRTLSVLTDLGPGRVTIYTNGCCAEPRFDSGAGNTNYHLPSGTGYGSTNGFAIGDNVIIQTGNNPNDVYTRARVAAVGTTNLTIFPATAPTATVTAGSKIYRVGTNAVFVGVTNQATSFSGNGVAAIGQKGQPMLIDIWATSAGFINAAAGEYIVEP